MGYLDAVILLTGDDGHLSPGLQSLMSKVWRGNLYAVILPAGVQPSLPWFTESDEHMWRGNLYAVILPTGVWPSLPRLQSRMSNVWRGNLYAVILLTGDGYLSLGLQSLMSTCGEDTSTQSFWEMAISS
jgi:hypothetical protein